MMVLIKSMCFNQSGRLLAVSSDKGTIHLFSMDKKR